jgi:hypothetical protein
MSPNITPREIMKMSNNSILFDIKERLTSLHHPPKIIKVQTHTNLPELAPNRRADELAKVNRQQDESTSREITSTKTRLLYAENQRVEQYPGTWIKQNHQRQTHQRSLTCLQNKVWPEIHDTDDVEVDWDTTIKLTKTGLRRLNRLDTTKHKQQAFRIKNLHKKLPTHVACYMHSNQTNTHFWRAPRCRIYEKVPDHL